MIVDYFIGIPFRLLKGLYDFFYFWYIKSSKDFWKKEMAFIKGVENDIGIIVNLRLITQPIYGDYSKIGRIIGPIFRLCRIVIGCFFVLLSFFAVIGIYFLWLLFPIVSVIMILKNLLYLLAN